MESLMGQEPFLSDGFAKNIVVIIIIIIDSLGRVLYC